MRGDSSLGLGTPDEGFGPGVVGPHRMLWYGGPGKGGGYLTPGIPSQPR